MVAHGSVMTLVFLVGSASVVAFGDRAAAGTGAETRPAAEAEFSGLHDAYVAKYKPLFLRDQQTWWEANITGTDAAFARYTAVKSELVDLHSDREVFARLKALREGGQVRDAVSARELDVMYRTFLGYQADPEIQKRIVALESDVEQIFNTHRGIVRGKTSTENEIRDILRKTTDSMLAEQAWKAYMEVGAKVAPKLRELVRLRNQVARELGFRDFYALSLLLQEIDEGELMKLFDELDAQTQEPFARLKREIDTKRAAHFGGAPYELRPWHFGDLFFQEAPDLEGANLDALFVDRDVIELAKTYYKGLGMPVERVLSRSDLSEKPGKSPHAFCNDMDRAGDVRILCNLKSDGYWMDTLLHELGHAVYDEHIGPKVPFLVHTAAHGITTEGVAVMFGSMSKNEEWLSRMLRVEPERIAATAEAARRALRAEKLIFSRWAQVMVRFEQGMYANPDQDLGKLWWDLKRRYQLLNPPDDVRRPDYGAKNHIVTTPVYYHNYMMGEMFAAQVQHHIARTVLGGTDPSRASFCDRADVGAYLKERVFEPGNLYAWNELIRKATGEPLSARYFAGMFLDQAPSGHSQN